MLGIFDDFITPLLVSIVAGSATVIAAYFAMRAQISKTTSAIKGMHDDVVLTKQSAKNLETGLKTNHGSASTGALLDSLYDGQTRFSEQLDALARSVQGIEKDNRAVDRKFVNLLKRIDQTSDALASHIQQTEPLVEWVKQHMD